MPYTHFQYIAYQIPTVALDNMGAANYGLPAGQVRNPPPLAGDLRNLSIDAQTRVERLIGAMIAADTQIRRLGDNDNTLKIFVAPEFYFRTNRVFVSYTYKEYQAIKEILRFNIMGQSRFRHWLVVPGTIMWRSDLNTPKRPNPRAWTVCYNSAIYVHGGGPLSHVIEKAMASWIDGIPTGRHSGPDVASDPTKLSTDEVFGLKYQSAAKRDKHLFTIEGVRFGLDICLEHAPTIRITKNAVHASRTHTSIQIHLLTAGGMPIVPQSIAASQRGYILRNDGLINIDLHGHVSPQTNCQQISGYDLPGAEFDLTTSAILGPDVDLAATIDIDAGHDLYLPAPTNAGQYWAAHPQQIKIYQRRVIP